MTSAPPPPPTSPHRGTTQAATLWWVGAVVAIVVLLVVLFQGGPDPSPTPSSSPVGPATTTQEPSRVESQTGDPDPEPSQSSALPVEYDLRQLSSLEFPESFEKYELTTQFTGSINRNANYDHTEERKLFTVLVVSAPDEFAYLVADLAAPVKLGNAVCGEVSEDGVVKACYMEGSDGALEVSSAGENMTLEDLAQIVQAFYALP